jgi:PAS domain S-box-containing protein
MSPVPFDHAANLPPGDPDDLMALRHQLTGLETLLEAVQDAVYVADDDGRILLCNAALVRMTGYAREELLARSSFTLYGPEVVPLLRASRAPHGEPVHSLLETDLCRQDGTRLPVELAITDFVLAQRFVGRAVVVRDLSERRQAAEALHQSEEQFRLLVESVEDYAIFMLDPQGFVTSWNPGAARIKGYQAEDIIGRHFACLYPPEDVAQGKPFRALERAATVGHYTDEGWRLRQDGTRFWAVVVITALRDAAGALRGFGKVTRDLTEQRRVEQERRRTEHLALLGRLAAGVSHELRNPLNTVFLHVDLLDEELQQPTPESPALMREAVATLKQAVSRLNELVQDYLSLARLASLQRERADFGLFLTAYAQEIDASLRHQGIIVHRDGLADLGLVAFHQNTFRRVLDNLVQNAVDAMPGGGTLTIRGRRTDTQIILDIGDTGEGIPPEHQAQVFEPLYTTKPAGTGLGLYLVREIVAAHDGHLAMQSNVGAGTTMTVTLPCLARAQTP